MPKTPVAVSLKPWRIWFMLKFMTEPMAIIMMEGTPTPMMGRMSAPSGRNTWRENWTSGLNRRLKKMARPAATHWPRTVATAAPATPMAGKPNQPKMNTGSSTMLMTAPVAWVIME